MYKVGDEVEIESMEGEIFKTKVIGIESFKKKQKEALSGDQVGIVFQNHRKIMQGSIIYK